VCGRIVKEIVFRMTFAISLLYINILRNRYHTYLIELNKRQLCKYVEYTRNKQYYFSKLFYGSIDYLYSSLYFKFSELYCHLIFPENSFKMTIPDTTAYVISREDIKKHTFCQQKKR